MQYIKADVGVQSFTFSNPVDAVSTDVIRFVSYARSFEVQPTSVVVGNLFTTVKFALTSEQVSYITAGITWNISYGTGRDVAQSNIPASQVIEYEG